MRMMAPRVAIGIVLVFALGACSGGGHSAPLRGSTTGPTGPGASVIGGACAHVKELLDTAHTVKGPDLSVEFEKYLGLLVDDISTAQGENNPAAATLLEAVRRAVVAVGDAGTHGGDVTGETAQLVRAARAAGC